MKTYKTHEIARLTGIHPNTVRFYEDVGLITPPERLPNGYRVYTTLQLKQIELARVALRAEVLQNGLRKKAVEIIKLCAALDLDAAVKSAKQYDRMLRREIADAKEAITYVESMLSGNREQDAPLLKRKEAACMLNVTVDTLRNWELNGLITVKRTQNGYRVYDSQDMKLLKIIRTLRCANYSLSAILRLINNLLKNEDVHIEKILNTPSEDEDIVSACDKLILSLEAALTDARHITDNLEEIKKLTLQ